MRLLIVEDDKTIALGMEYALAEEGFEVNIAGNLKSAAEFVKENRHDLIILDVMLPDGTGYDFCRDIRRTSEVPIIFLTACDEEINIVMGLDMGGDDYITKPFRVRELISRINAVLRRKGKGSVDKRILSFGDLRVYPLEGKVYRGESELVLTSVEYRLLLALCKNPGIVMSRSQILDALWDYAGEFVNDNTLTVYIKRLREKIEENNSEPKYIATIRGMGYKWICEEGAR
jgi:DNA-binding response OmpR family regulator